MNELSATLNIIGLVLDIAGAALIFKFGLPAEISRSGVNYLALEQGDQAEITKGRLYDRWARTGLGLLILGFAVQAVGNATVFW